MGEKRNVLEFMQNETEEQHGSDLPKIDGSYGRFLLVNA